MQTPITLSLDHGLNKFALLLDTFIFTPFLLLRKFGIACSTDSFELLATAFSFVRVKFDFSWVIWLFDQLSFVALT